VTTRRADGIGLTGGELGSLEGGSLRMRPMVEAARCRPARASTCAIFTLPMLPHNPCSRCTIARTNSGYLLTGSGVRNSGSCPPSSRRLPQEAIVASVT
jgi:hypothetical protein